MQRRRFVEAVGEPCRFAGADIMAVFFAPEMKHIGNQRMRR